MSFDYMNPLFLLASMPMNRIMWTWFQNQYNIVNDSRVNMNVFYADYIPALNATGCIMIMNDADTAFNDFRRFTIIIMGVMHGSSFNGCEYTCCIRLLSIISMLLASSPRLNPGIPCEYYGVPRPIHMALTVINLFHRAGIVSTPCLKLIQVWRIGLIMLHEG